ncbi:MAG: glucose-6-phosphate isomerase, partial [Deltaproteobacteria bacterium]|nr:glucose-6-phosphate isomerase [Deltaproteobacteria bacterium]
MPSHPDILLDFGPMMSESVGQNGITLQEVESIEPQAKKISQGLSDLRRLGQLPFQDLPYREDLATQILEKTKIVKEKFETILLIGIGGSSLGAQFLNSSLGSFSKSNLHICDHIDPVLWKHLDESLDYQKTILLVISKSGRTIETLAAFLYFQEKFKKKLGLGFRKNLFIITDPKEGPLRRLAHEEKIDSFEIPQPVGGRYSLLTAAGLFPAACVGVDLFELMAGARRMDERCKKNDLWFNPALMNATLHHLASTIKNRKLRIVMPYGERLRDYAPWFAQLWAESLGKRQSLQGRDVFAGTTPVTARG